MQHYKIGILFYFLLFIFGCTASEPPKFLFDVVVENTSSQAFTLTLAYPNELQYQERFEPGDRNVICQYISESFFGISPECSSIATIEFDNGKGYRCDRSLTFVEDTLCFENRELLVQLGYRQEGESTYTFTINEDHFLNANDL